jgi:site-specific recombinase XerD
VVVEDRSGLRQAAGIARLHPHSLRHACAAHLLQGGADIAHVQKILGPSQITTTAEYVKVVERKHPR